MTGGRRNDGWMVCLYTFTDAVVKFLIWHISIKIIKETTAEVMVAAEGILEAEEIAEVVGVEAEAIE